MPNCPVCGKEVQPTTQYCPACGTNLTQGGPQSTQAATYSPTYSYPQQEMGMPGASQPHTHRKHVFAIIAALLVGLIVGGIIGFSFPIAADYTHLTGSVRLSNQFQGIPNLIMFNSTLYGNLTSAVFSDHSYIINLPIGDTYNVSIQWFNATATTSQIFGRCIPSQSTFTSDSQNATQDFTC